MKYTFICLFGLVMSLLWGCDNDDYVWNGQDYARLVGPEIWTQGTDSMTFTFSVYPTDTVRFVVESEIFVQGRVSDNDRTIRLQVDETNTTAPADSYSVPEEVVLRGGEHSADFDILIYRIPEIQERDITLHVRIAPGGDLDAGVSSASSLTITWNDKITRPSNWDDLEEFFGTYSEVKYRFIISTLGISVFPYGEGEFTWGRMWNYHLQMVAALEDFNNDPDNPEAPLTDENGGVVSFN